jgi:hypothetical protein
MSTSMSIHAERGDKIAVEVKDWGTYMSVTVTFGRNSIAMYPKEHEGVSVAEQIHEVLKAFANASVSFPNQEN